MRSGVRIEQDEEFILRGGKVRTHDILVAIEIAMVVLGLVAVSARGDEYFLIQAGVFNNRQIPIDVRHDHRGLGLDKNAALKRPVVVVQELSAGKDETALRLQVLQIIERTPQERFARMVLYHE